MTSPSESTDILGPLRARLSAIDNRRTEEKRRHDAALQTLDGESETVKAMIALEEKRNANGSAKPKAPLMPGARNEMESEILRVLNDRHVWPLNAIKMHLIHKGLGKEDDPQFGRATHALLLSMSKREVVLSKGDGQWQAALIRRV